jgi:glucokinase
MSAGFVTIDIGGTYVRSAVVRDGQVCGIVRRERVPNFLVRNGSAPEELQEELVTWLDREARQLGDSESLERPLRLGVSFPGPVDRRGTVLSAPTLWGPAIRPFPLRDRLIKALESPHVFVLNDMAAAACYYADRTPATTFCVVTVSSGIGNKVFDRRHPGGVLLGEDGYGGEIGHVTVDASSEAPLCDCGGRGHLGAIASGRGVERLARRRAARGETSFWKSAVFRAVSGDWRAITNEEHLVPAIRAGDPFATETLEEATRPLVHCLATLALGIGVEQFILVGGFASAVGTRYIETVRRLWDEQASYHMARVLPEDFLVSGPGGDEACLVGAATVATGRSATAERPVAMRGT